MEADQERHVRGKWEQPTPTPLLQGTPEEKTKLLLPIAALSMQELRARMGL